MTTCVFFAGGKGGSTKTSSAHLGCLGAILRGEPAVYVTTDPERKVRGEGRPYTVIDGRNPRMLSTVMSVNRSGENGWLIIDGGGNRPEFDKTVAAESDLVLLPFRASEEDVDMVALDLQRLPNAVAWPSAWPTNKYAVQAAQHYIAGLSRAFPLRVIQNPIPFVNSISDLLAQKLESPSTPVRSVARKVFDEIAGRAGKRPDEPRMIDEQTSKAAQGLSPPADKRSSLLPE